MSVRGEHTVGECDVSAGTGALRMRITPRERDLGGFVVRRVLPTVAQRSVGPWIFFDHLGPVQFQAGMGIDVRPHPHIGLATVTYLFEGEMLHRDSLGNEQTIVPGDVNLMVAGRGITHSERQRPEVRAGSQDLHGLQLWLALPAEEEEREPEFFHYGSLDIPALRIDGVAVRIIMGSAYGATSPVRTFANTLYVEAHLQAGQRLLLPEATERAIYVAKGSLLVHSADREASADETEGTQVLSGQTMGVFTAGAGASVVAREETRICLIGGESLGPRFMEWNFVSTRKERIEKAKEDWASGRFPRVVGDETEFIPLP